MKVTFLQPHQDDAIIGAGGCIVKLLEDECDISYLYFTDGRHGGNIDPEKTKKIRQEEAKKREIF